MSGLARHWLHVRDFILTQNGVRPRSRELSRTVKPRSDATELETRFAPEAESPEPKAPVVLRLKIVTCYRASTSGVQNSDAIIAASRVFSSTERLSVANRRGPRKPRPAAACPGGDRIN